MAKICPLLLIASKGSPECPQDKCAWYVRYEATKSEGCAIENLSGFLRGIGLKIIKSNKI